jgi:hypothetical protein
MRTALRLAALGLLAAAPAFAAGADRAAALRAAAALEQAGDYRGAVLGYMDMVIADPSDEGARAGLRAAAAQVQLLERQAASVEREILLSGAGRDRRRTLAMRAAGEKRLRAWKKNFSKACSLASDADTVKEAVSAYERLLAAAPVYSFDGGYLTEAAARIKGVFFKTIKREFPYLLEGRDYADERDLASLMFARASVQDDTERYVNTGAAQDVLNRADRLRRLERDLAAQHRNLEKGIAMYERDRYADALKYFDEILAFDRRNEEVLLYSAAAKEKIAAEAGRKNTAPPAQPQLKK